MLSGSPSRSRGPGSSSRKKSASCASKDRRPFGTILIGRWSESDCRDVSGSGADSRVDPGGVLVGTAGAPGEAVPPAAWRNRRRSSAMSLAVLYRSDARFASDFWQIRSSSLGIVSSIWRGGRGSVVLIDSRTSRRDIAAKRPLRGQQLVEHDPQAEDIRTTIDPVAFTPGLFGAHIGRRAGQPPTLAEVFILEREPEVRHARLCPMRRSGCWRA